MTDREDTLSPFDEPKRMLFAAGMLLDAEDFRCEQDYHRGRLARLLATVAGAGTVVGLAVEFEDEEVDTNGETTREARLAVRPGLAIDAVGRLIELPRSWCTRVDAWWDGLDADDLARARHAADPSRGIGADGVVADVHLAFRACEDEPNPAFRDGPFDALDAVRPSRLVDHFALTMDLVERPEVRSGEPHWLRAALDGVTDPDRDAIVDAILNGWRDRDDPFTADRPRDERILLARVAFPLDSSTPPLRDRGAAPSIDNRLRDFVLPLPALERWLSAAAAANP